MTSGTGSAKAPHYDRRTQRHIDKLPAESRRCLDALRAAFPDLKPRYAVLAVLAWSGLSNLAIAELLGRKEDAVSQDFYRLYHDVCLRCIDDTAVTNRPLLARFIAEIETLHRRITLGRLHASGSSVDSLSRLTPEAAMAVGTSGIITMQHGVSCPKAPHQARARGYLHAPDNDRPYDVDGVQYCGRCHMAL